ncbi:sulfurtransferase complex subunit TusC [Catenovulum sp. 2E275]|uniref:sulfurtransferase complex subunit TusC n=1 Tax=Catenovulum sp. 2E275 TaxID=2980497 RepID=UPI0021D172EC|nr:sulfurtransferase complex subunit TusC [Catenovulum sp. 2E275]MCU4677681.1 sulfurtransferase complex subunit TusC [Catenovulum sp. 2E275]
MAYSHAIIFKQSPFQNKSGQDALELALTLATFEQDVALFFKDAGVLQLVKNLNGQIAGRKTYTAAFKSLDLYDIEQVFVCENSLAKFGLTEQDLIIPVSLINVQNWREQLGNHQRILTF